MRKHNNYKKIPKLDANGQPKLKSMLLRTYFTSLLCLVLCVAMFFGTSFAWFTSEVNNQGNEIYIGVLDVELEKEVPDGTADSDNNPDWVSLSATNDEGDNTTKLFDSAIRWEPGYTSLEKIKVINEGDLAFNYVLSFTYGTGVKNEDALSGDQLKTAAEYFEVWVYDHAQDTAEKTYTKPASYEAIAVKDSGWVLAGSLAEILDGKSVLEGSTSKEEIAAQANEENTESHTYTIALHMRGDAEESVMGYKISLNVKLIAYQKVSETYGQYDNVEFVFDQEQLQVALDEASKKTLIILGDDIEGDVTVTQKPDVKITIDGNGKTLEGVITVDGKSETITSAGLTIKNVTFDADSISADACIRLGDGTNATRYTCNVTVENCTFDVPGAVGIKSYTGGDKNVTIKGCTTSDDLHSLGQLKGIDGVLVEGCNVTSVRGINFNNSDNVTVKNSTIDVQKYAVRFGESANTTVENYKIIDCTIASDNVDGDAAIVLRAGATNANLTLTNTTITAGTQMSGHENANVVIQ